MKYKFSELVDLQSVSKLFGHFYEATGVKCDVFGRDGTPLTRSAWENICVDFHRKNPRTCRLCVESDTNVANSLLRDKKYAIYKCKNGLMDAAAMIMVGGEHIANVFAGQVFFEPPDLDWFRRRAREFGFDQARYLEAVLKVPIMPRDRIETVLKYLSRLAEFLGELGLRHLKQLEAEEAFRMSENEYRNIFENSIEGIFRVGPDGKYMNVNPAQAQTYGFDSPEQLMMHAPEAASHLFLKPEDRRRFCELLEEQGVVKGFEGEACTKDGHKIWVSVSARTMKNETGSKTYEGTVENITDRKTAEIGMMEAQAHLENLSRGLLKKMEIERRYIAHELHDEIGQALTVVKMSLESLRGLSARSELTTRIDESVQVIDAAMEQVRDLSVNLRPAVLDDLGLVAALRWLVISMSRKSGLAIRFEVEDEDMEPGISSWIASACFRVTQEAVTNVVRHAKASHISVGLQTRGNKLELTVCDDGVGFDVKSAQDRQARGESFGLLGMQQRVALSGGSLRVVSSLGSGTRIVAHFPLGEINAEENDTSLDN
ncbi:MAG: PocR ligand-binding domain-containing protein [Syntrophorhabdales bacterium]|jgi:PAS domain S-box-containing protein